MPAPPPRISCSINVSPDNSKCLHEPPKIIVGGSGNSNVSGVSGGAFIDNAEFREYTFNTFGAQVLDMESTAVAHVAYSKAVPFIAIRSLSDLAGGEDGENELPIFFSFAAKNSAEVVKALLQKIPK